MARQPNYGHDKRRKEQERKAKKDAKRAEREQRRAERGPEESSETGVSPDADGPTQVSPT